MFKHQLAVFYMDHFRTGELEKSSYSDKIFAMICQVRLNCTVLLHDIMAVRTRLVSW